MNLLAFPSSRIHAEKTIAAIRVVLAGSSLIAVWLDPAGPAPFADATYWLHGAYLIYALTLAATVARRPPGARMPIVTHAIDIGAFSVFQYLTLGPSSPFFVYFAFSVICGGMRWGTRGTVWTTALVLFAYLLMSVSMLRTVGPSEFELNRVITRVLYLAIASILLVWLGRYQERLRTEMQQLARWPSAAGIDIERTLERVLAHACRLVGAQRALVVWEAEEEPTVYAAVWSADGLSLARHAPDQLRPVVEAPYENSAFFCPRHLEVGALVPGRRSDFVAAPDLTVHGQLRAIIHGTRLMSAPFETGRVSGRVFLMEIGPVMPESMPLVEVVAREIGGSLDQLHATRQLRDMAAGEERLRVARDLHDGVLQSLTGVRLELRAAATGMPTADARDRLLGIERALAIEQRELRLFIGGLKPAAATAATPASLAARLEALRERVALEWKAPVSIRVAPALDPIPEHLEQAVPLMVHEAVVNALKHGKPSRVTVTVDRPNDDLLVTVADDGRGFAFRGRYDHAEIEQRDLGPKSLLDRVTALGGRLSIESSDAGACIEVRLPCTELIPWPSVSR